jgi:hypothetical protein
MKIVAARKRKKRRRKKAKKSTLKFKKLSLPKNDPRFYEESGGCFFVLELV